MFDITCNMSDDLKVFIYSSKQKRKVSVEAIKKDLITFFRPFFEGGRVIRQRMRHLTFSTSSMIDSKTIFKELLSKKWVQQIPQKHAYNIAISRVNEDSARHLVHDNYSDIHIDKLINDLFEKYYK